MTTEMDVVYVETVWIIQKHAAIPDHPVDTPAASIVGPNTDAVSVVPLKVLEQEQDRSQGLEETGNRLALMLAASFHHNGYGTPEHEERCREAMRQWAALSTAPEPVDGDVSRGE